VKLKEDTASELPVRVYKPISENAGFFIYLFQILKDLPVANALGYRLAMRNIKAKYRQSILGLFWAVLPPVATSVIWIFLNSAKIVKMQSPDLPYPVFVFCGTIIWQVFASSVLGILQSVSQNQSLLVKINFTRESVFISAFYEILFNAIITFVIVTIFIISFGMVPDWKIILYFPVLLVLIFAGMTFGLFLLPISILYKDIQMGLPVVLQILMYLSPVVYVSGDMLGLGAITEYNPLTFLINILRGSLTGGSIENYWLAFGIIASAVSVLMLIGMVIQKVTLEILVERMGS
jgi:lipopolysaccharide transport system permease protein